MISNKATIPQVIEKIKIILKSSRLWVGSNFTPLESMMAARPQKATNEPFWQAAVRRFNSTQSALRVVIPPPPRTIRKYCAQSEKTATSPSCKQITQPSGAATPRDSDAHKRIAVPKALCVLWEHPRPSPKSGKVCRFNPRPRRVSETCGTLRG